MGEQGNVTIFLIFDVFNWVFMYIEIHYIIIIIYISLYI